MSALNVRTPLQIEVRKLRKKLRQIDNLLRIDRDLTDEELLKVARREKLRNELQLLLSSLQYDSMSDHSEISTDFDTSLQSSAEWSNVSSLLVHNEDVSSLSQEQISLVEDNTSEKVTQDDSVSKDGEQNDYEYLAPQSDNINQRNISCNNSGLVDEINDVMSQGDCHSTVTTFKDDKPNLESKKKKNMSKLTQPCLQTELTNTSDKVAKQSTTTKTKIPPFREKCFSVVSLEGHNDLVTSIRSDGHFAVTGSRDTTLRCWDVGTGLEVRSFGGHTGTVTSLALLNEKLSQDLIELFREENDLEFGDNERVIFSGSTDCSIKVWALKVGKLIKNIYTFNPITNLGYINEDKLLVASTVGGKVELWNPHSGQNIFSTIAHKESISCLQIKDSFIYTGSADGEIQIHQYKNKSLIRMYLSENIKLKSGGSVIRRSIRCIYCDEQTVYYGDDGSNVKVLYWKDGTVDKLCNHQCEFGTTNAIVVFDKVLYTSGYNIDNGLGYINCRSACTGQYMGTLCDEESGYITSLCSVKSNTGKLVLIVGGTDLKMWVESKNTRKGDHVVHPHYIKYYEKEANHSDIESDSDADDSDECTENIPGSSMTSSNDEKQHDNSWLSWCTVL